jgi:hypothetical protein
MIELPPKLRGVLNEVQHYIESVTEVDDGILVVPNRRLSIMERLKLAVQLNDVKEFEYLAISDSYLIRKETLIAQHLAKLKLIFQNSHAEISESMSFLLAAGVSFDRIQNETGASRATIYRYTKKPGK